MSKHIHVTPEAGKQFYLGFHQKGRNVMQNLLKFRANADYTDLPMLNPNDKLNGREAYNLYMGYTMPFLTDAVEFCFMVIADILQLVLKTKNGIRCYWLNSNR